MRAAGVLVLVSLACCLSWPEHLVESDGGSADRGKTADRGAMLDKGPCPTACTNKCVGGRCKLECAGSASCVCPPGLACEVDCSGSGACGGGVDCANATSCKVTCGEKACGKTITCPASGPCDVTCDHEDACKGRISCGAGPCKVDCSDETSCAGGVDCAKACSCAVKEPGSGSPVQVTCPPFCAQGCSAKEKCDQC